MKIGIAQINTKVGDIEGNCRKILSACEKFANEGADFAVFPEMSVSGYPLKDFIFLSGLVENAQEAMRTLAKKLPLPAVVGCPCKGDGAIGFFNAAYFLDGAEVKFCHKKHLLPNYGVLNDARNFDAGEKLSLLNFKGKKIAISICEDIWTLPEISTSARYKRLSTPISQIEKSGEKPDLLINISASVFSSGNDRIRKNGGMLCGVSAKLGAPLVWCNLVGGADSIIFAGGSGVFDAREKNAKCECLKKFEEDFKIIDTENLPPVYTGGDFDFGGISDIRKALVLSLRDFVQKCGMKKVALGLSGGLDSAVVAALAVEALGSENVVGVSMPSKFSSDHSRSDAEALAKNLGIEYHTVSIEKIVDSFEGSLAEIFSGMGRGLAEENIQARARGVIMMAISNKFGAMVLTTGNKSECAVGYCTLYGDTCGGFAPICDIYKTQVYELARHINSGGQIIPQNTIDKPPSAELRPDQKDEDSLPPYEVLDEILRLHIEENKNSDEISALGFDGETVKDVLKKVFLSEHKRAQYPTGPKVSPLAFSERIIPIAKKF